MGNKMYGRIYIYTEIFHNAFLFSWTFFSWTQNKLHLDAIQNTKHKTTDTICELEGNMFSGISKND